jgi:hypothetical protein
MGHHAACSDEGVMVWGLKIFDQFWTVFIAFIGGNSSNSTPMNLVRHSAVVLGIISQLNATTPCPIGAIPEVLSPW